MATIDQRSALSRVFQLLHLAEQRPRGLHGPSIWWDRQRRPGFGFSGEGLTAFWEAVDSLTTPALSGQGLSQEEAERIVTDVSRGFVDDGEEAALELLEARLSAQSKQWIVVKAWTGLEVEQGHELKVGACTIRQGLPEEASDTGVADDWRGGHTIAVEVTARDAGSAEVLAIQHMDEAIAVLHSADTTAQLSYGPDSLLVNDEAITRRHAEGGGMGLVRGFFDASGRVSAQPFRYLSSAAATPPGERTEWQRRVVTAARWHSRAITSQWPTDALVAAVVAVEALLGQEGEPVRGKGDLRGGAAATLLGGDADQRRDFRKWFRAVYERGRSPAVHFGREHSDEIQVRQLVDICGRLVERAAFHLNPGHAPGGACQDLSAVMSCRTRPPQERRRRGSQGRAPELTRPPRDPKRPPRGRP